MLDDVEAQIAPVVVFHEDVKVLFVLKGEVHRDDQRVIQLLQDLVFAHYRLYGVLLNHSYYRT